MEDIDQKQTEENRTKIPWYIWLFSWLIAAFYLLSAMGWYMAAYMAHTGLLGEELVQYSTNLSALDLAIQHLSVGASIIASILLMCMKKSSFYIFSIVLPITIAGWVVNNDWAISYLSPILLLPVWIYLYFIKEREYFKSEIIN